MLVPSKIKGSTAWPPSPPGGSLSRFFLFVWTHLLKAWKAGHPYSPINNKQKLVAQLLIPLLPKLHLSKMLLSTSAASVPHLCGIEKMQSIFFQRSGCSAGRHIPLIHVRKQSKKPNHPAIKLSGLHLRQRWRTNRRSHLGCPSLFLLRFCGNGKKVKYLFVPQISFT